MCSGTASLAPEDRVELLAVLASDVDSLIAERAAGALLSQPVDAFLSALARPDAPLQLLRHCSANLAEKSGIADALAKNPKCPGELLVPVVRHLTTAAVQALMDDLDRLSSTPALAAALAHSNSLTADQRQQLQELQQDAGEESAFAEAAQAVVADGAKRQTLLQKLGRMRVIERVQLALKGNSEERMTLIRDPCKIVQRAVLQSPRLTDREVEAFSAMANLSDEVMRLIATNRNFLKNYTIVRNLMNNPKTPLDISLHLLANINPQDLKLLTLNRNIPETLRTMATRLERRRKLEREGGS